MRLQHVLATLPILTLAIEHRELLSFVARGTDAAFICRQNGCKCQPGVRNGQICGLDIEGGNWIITDLGTGGSWDDIYECNAHGGCCDYGYATKCHALGEEINERAT